MSDETQDILDREIPATNPEDLPISLDAISGTWVPLHRGVVDNLTISRAYSQALAQECAQLREQNAALKAKLREQTPAEPDIQDDPHPGRGEPYTAEPGTYVREPETATEPTALHVVEPEAKSRPGYVSPYVQNGAGA